MKQYYRERANKKNVGYILKDSNPFWVCFYSYHGITSDDITKDDFLKKYEEVDETTNVYLNLLDKYENEQMVVAVEELSELQKEICKAMRKVGEITYYPTNGLTEEIADVEIMLEQVKLYYNIDQNAVEEQKQAKIKRTVERCLHDD